MGNQFGKGKSRNESCTAPLADTSIPRFGHMNSNSTTTNKGITQFGPSLLNKNRFSEPPVTIQQTNSTLIRQPLTISHPNLLAQPKPTFSVEQPKKYPAIAQIPNCQSYEIWKNCYQRHQIEEKYLGEKKTQIADDGIRRFRENEEKRLQIQRQRQIAESKLYSERESIMPDLTLPSFFDLGAKFKALREFDRKFFSPKPERPELTPEMLMRIELASKPLPAEQVLVEIDGVQILRKDIRTLTGLNWLNDEVINAYMHLLVMRGGQSNYSKVYAFNTFFYPKVRDSGYNSVKRWTRKVDIFSYDFLLVPVHLGNHWCLAVVDLKRKIISYYDSMGGRPNGCCDTLLEYLRYESNDKKKLELDDENYRLIDKYHEEGIPEQHNCSDCGVFACTYAEYLTRGAKLTFKQEHMPYFRKKMIYELLTKSILQ